MKYLIIGGVAGGATAAARLRRLDENAEIVIFEKGKYVSFSNCGLPYYVGKKIPKLENLLLMTPEEFLNSYNIDVRVNNMVTAVNADDKEITVNDLDNGKVYRENYDKLIISPGVHAIKPNFDGIDKMPAFTMKTLDDVSAIVDTIEEKNAKHLTIVGAGFIGVEAAENLIERGLRVTIIETLNQVLLWSFDHEMATILHKELMDNGVELILNDRVTGFGEKSVYLDSGKTLSTDAVILSIGVRPDTAFLEESSITLDAKGYIDVNDNYQTNYPDVYAIGDAIKVKFQLAGIKQPLALAGPANKQGRMVADHIHGLGVFNTKGYIGSSVIQVFNFNAASTGMSENFIKDIGNIKHDCVYLGSSDKVGIMPNANPIMMKIIFNPDNGKVLGAQAISRGASDKRIDVIATGIKFGMTVEDMRDLELCYAPPYSTGKEAVNHAGYLASNIYQNFYKQVDFRTLHTLIDEGAQIIDVRNPHEYAAGHLITAKNIPMCDIRKRLDEIDKTRPVYLHCRTAQRSYNVTRILMAYGFDAYNINGSYLFFSFYEDTLCRLDSSRKKILTQPNFN